MGGGRVNLWLRLYVYVLHTGFSKIGLVLAGQLHAQRQLVPLCQALFGTNLVTGLRSMQEEPSSGFLDGQQWKDWVPECQSWGGNLQFLWCFHSTWSTLKKKKNNMMWLRRFCTCRLPICACLSPFLHIRPFSDVLLNTNYLCKGHVTAIIISVYIRWHTLCLCFLRHKRELVFEKQRD